MSLYGEWCLDWFFPEIVFLPCDYDDYGCDDCVFGHVFYAVDINHD